MTPPRDSRPPDADRCVQRLRRIEGQVRGLQRMVARDDCCVDILTQLAAVQHALDSFGVELLRTRLAHVAEAVADDPAGVAATSLADAVQGIERLVRS